MARYALADHVFLCVSGEHLVLLNNDTEIIEPKWLSSMVGYAAAPGVGAVGAAVGQRSGELAAIQLKGDPVGGDPRRFDDLSNESGDFDRR